MASITPMSHPTVDKIETLRHLRADRAAAKSVYEALDDEYTRLRAEVLDELKRMPYAASKQLMKEQAVTLTSKQTVRVTDPIAVATWLSVNGYKQEDYLKLDTTRVKSVLENAVFTDGLVIDGTEIVPVEYISLKEQPNVA